MIIYFSRVMVAHAFIPSRDSQLSINWLFSKFWNYSEQDGCGLCLYSPHPRKEFR